MMSLLLEHDQTLRSDVWMDNRPGATPDVVIHDVFAASTPTPLETAVSVRQPFLNLTRC